MLSGGSSGVLQRTQPDSQFKMNVERLAKSAARRAPFLFSGWVAISEKLIVAVGQNTGAVVLWPWQRRKPGTSPPLGSFPFASAPFRRDRKSLDSGWSCARLKEDVFRRHRHRHLLRRHPPPKIFAPAPRRAGCIVVDNSSARQAWTSAFPLHWSCPKSELEALEGLAISPAELLHQPDGHG